MKNKLTIHLIPNAHLDPVWLWDWREGLNEGLITCRTILDLMDEFTELTFIRGEAAIYQHIEEHDPQTFRRIAKYVAAGRWDVVGGTVIQPDTNLPATETFARHFAHGQNYFLSRFGKQVRVAWAADSFGHSAGLPEILSEAGIQGYVFSRPDAQQVRLAKPAFWWEGPSGARVMGYRVPVGWYGSERHELLGKLDSTLATGRQGDLENIGCFLGLGNHGGGPTRHHILEVRDWAARHPEVRVIYSGLHRLIAALSGEVKRKGSAILPTHRGELNFCLRGCYSSVAKFKFAYRHAEAAVSRAERTMTAIGLAGNLRPAWNAVLFNSFHDILPGSSTERAFDDQLAWIGGAIHQSQCGELAALNQLAMQVDTSVPKVPRNHPTAVPFLVWNPHPHPLMGHIELEASLDYRPIRLYENRADQLPVEVRGPTGQSLPFQQLATENRSMVNLAWRKRVVVPVTLPALGWSVLTMGWVEGAVQRPRAAVKLPVVAKVGASSIRLWNKLRLSALTMDDPWGSWGGMTEEKSSLDLSKIRQRWKIVKVEQLECGPERSTVWVQLTGGKSRLELAISQDRNRAALDIKARVFWNERSARLKLVFGGAHAQQAQFEVPGGTVVRGPVGEVPGGRWVRFGRYGIASDALYSFALNKGDLHSTICRASRYADDVPTPPNQMPWLPAVDAGELKFKLLVTPDPSQLGKLAEELAMPPVAQIMPAKVGKWDRSGSFAMLQPASLQLLALKRAEDGQGVIVRVQSTAEKSTPATLLWLGKKLNLGMVNARAIASWRLQQRRNRWTAHRTSIIET